MDDVFDSGLPAWKAGKVESRLDRVTRDIEAGNMKVARHGVEDVNVEPKA